MKRGNQTQRETLLYFPGDNEHKGPFKDTGVQPLDLLPRPNAKEGEILFARRHNNPARNPKVGITPSYCTFCP